MGAETEVSGGNRLGRQRYSLDWGPEEEETPESD